MVYALDISSEAVNPVAKFGNLASLLNIIIPLISTVAALAFLLMMLLGSFQWITAGGDHKNVEKAQKTITFAVVGLFIIFMSYFGIKLVGMILHVNMPL